MSNNAHSLQVELQQSIDEALEFLSSMQRKYDAAKGGENEDYYANKLEMAKTNLHTLEAKLSSLKAQQNQVKPQSIPSNAATNTVSEDKISTVTANTEDTSSEQSSAEGQDLNSDSDLLLDTQRDQDQAVSQILQETTPKSRSHTAAIKSDSTAKDMSMTDSADCAVAIADATTDAAHEAASSEDHASESAQEERASGADHKDAAADEHFVGRKARAKVVKAHNGRKDLSETRIVGDSVYLQDKKNEHTQMRIKLRHAIAKAIESTGERLPDWFTLSCRIASLFKTMSVQEIEYTSRTLLSAAWRRKSSSVGVKTAAMRKLFADDLVCTVDSHRLAIRASESVMSKERSKLFVRCKKAIEGGKASSIEAFAAMCREFATDFVHLTEREIVLRCRLQWYQHLVDFAKLTVDRKSLQVEYNKRILKDCGQSKPTLDDFVFTSGNSDDENKAIERGLEKYQKAVRDYIQAAKFHFVPTADEVFDACKHISSVVADSEKHYICEVMCNRYESQVLQMRNQSFKQNDKNSLRNAIKRLALLTEEKNAIAKTLQSFLSRLNTLISSMKSAAKEGLALSAPHSMQLDLVCAGSALVDEHLSSLADTEKITDSIANHEQTPSSIASQDQMSVAYADSQASSSNESASVTADTKDMDAAIEASTAAATKTESEDAQSTQADSGDNAQTNNITSKSITSTSTNTSIASTSCSSADKKSDAAAPDIAKQDLKDEQALEDAPLFRHAESEAAPIEQGTAAIKAEENGATTQSEENGTAASSSMQSGERASLPNGAREQNMPVANGQRKLGGNNFEGFNASNVSVQKESENMQGERRLAAAKVAPEGEKISLSAGDRMAMGPSYRRRNDGAAQNRPKSDFSVAPQMQQALSELYAKELEKQKQMQNQNSQQASSFARVEDVFSSEDGCNIDTRSILHREHQQVVTHPSVSNVTDHGQASGANGYSQPQHVAVTSNLQNQQPHSSIFAKPVHSQNQSSVFSSQGNNQRPNNAFVPNEHAHNEPRSMFGRFNPFHR
ncbi:MAG: hypothetical protein SOV16_07465 [Anaerobiospirillum succiniciproducens]|uniref:hypothetical protein n=1 Tax=Anaerobiospirillum succiniciproducens TaxID=13335 RepID=UPI002A75E016|nr:hypothetical protein [Anaerobiospirillum succiniciproducens]MDY2798981.1 hypothetical protein [Anaerobiospirillum succiniciproducens]